MERVSVTLNTITVNIARNLPENVAAFRKGPHTHISGQLAGVSLRKTANGVEVLYTDPKRNEYRIGYVATEDVSRTRSFLEFVDRLGDTAPVTWLIGTVFEVEELAQIQIKTNVLGDMEDE